MIAFICGSEKEAEWLQLRFVGATGSDMIFVTPNSAAEMSGITVTGYIVTEQAHKLALESNEYRNKLHNLIWMCERRPRF